MSEYNIGHLTAESPFGNAGGVVKRVEDVEKMAHTGVGWIEAGSYTLEPREGNGPNGEVVYYHNEETGETLNSLGMPNKGMDAVEQEIPHMVEAAHGLGKPLVVNVAPISDSPAEESQELVSRAYEAGADAVLLNAGCPNVITKDVDRHEILSHNAKALSTVLEGLRVVIGDQSPPVFIRTSPMIDVKGIGRQRGAQVMQVIRQSGAVGAVFTPNTWPGHRPLDEDEEPVLEVPGGIGGKSGPATAQDASQETLLASYCMRGCDIDVVSSGGITTGRELAHRKFYSCASVGSGTTLFYESQDWEHAVDKLLWEFQDSC